jgi:serine/threonine protein kinase
MLRMGTYDNTFVKIPEKFSWIERLITLKDIAKGLKIIHNAGYVHRDLHPGNILRHGSWTMISDLGLTWNQNSVLTKLIAIILRHPIFIVLQ